MAERRAIMSTLLEEVFKAAETNRGAFPRSLNEVGNSFEKPIVIENYIYFAGASARSDRINKTNIVIGENPRKLPGKRLYFVAMEGKYIITLTEPEYLNLLELNRGRQL